METSPLVTILIPTFNEEGNIRPLIERIHKALGSFQSDPNSGEERAGYEILFVDDSTDSTAEIVTEIAENDPSLRVYKRPESERTGLSSAFVDGFQKAKGTYICCLDSDLQHPPEVVNEMTSTIIDSEADIVVASRYTKQGSAQGLGNWKRKFISWGLKHLSHLLLPKTRATSDPGGGFFMFRKQIIEDVTLKPKGFKILIEILVRGNYSTAEDIPYVFQKREHEESKATLNQGVLILKHLLYLLVDVPESNRLLKFALVGGSGVLVNVITLYILVEFVNVSATLGWFGAVALSITTNFILNNLFTYRDIDSSSFMDIVRKFGYFAVGASFSLVINFVIFQSLLQIGTFYLIASLAGIVAGMVFNFTVAQVFVWKPLSNSSHSESRKNQLKNNQRRNMFVLGIIIPAFTVVLAGVIYLTIGNESIFVTVLSLISLLIILEGLFTIYIMLYTWDDPERIDTSVSPSEFTDPQYSFSILLPARHEKNVIGETIKSIVNLKYPQDQIEAFVICRSDDEETIKAAEDAIQELHAYNVELLIFDDTPINKPHGLNLGLKRATHDIVCIFDAEDEPNPNILNVVNSVMTNENPEIIQSGVQLMNYKSNWYSLFNVLEYFFWFKSSLHFFADVGFIPLGGNTVFFKRDWLEAAGGWDEQCLTEDADIGIRLSLMGAKTKVVYDAQYVTEEETPPNFKSFVKQRTRWNQGFLQILVKRIWLQLSQVPQIFLALYILSAPFLQGILFLFVPFSIWLILNFDLPVLIAMLTNIPLVIIVLQFIVYNIGLYKFTKEYNLTYNWWMPIAALVCYIPFQVALGFSAFRSMWRFIRNHSSWEKTEHTNAHRMEPGQVVPNADLSNN